MSARKYLSAREKNRFECLPHIHQKSRSELPPLAQSAASRRRERGAVNRNLYSYDELPPYFTTLSDFSESGTSTPDFLSEESDSSAGSALRRSTDEATRALADEWERIERTMYNEEGEQSMRPEIIEECIQWRRLHPQFRVVGKALQLPNKKPHTRSIECNEANMMQYHDEDDDFTESEDEMSESSMDNTPQNSPRISIQNLSFRKQHEQSPRIKMSRLDEVEEKQTYPSLYNEPSLQYAFCSLLNITALRVRSPIKHKRPNTLLKSGTASSRWQKNLSPKTLVHPDRNSAKSFVSLDTVASATNDKIVNSRVLTARNRDIGRLEPLCTPGIPENCVTNGEGNKTQHYNLRKVSLPPLQFDKERKEPAKSYSAMKYNKSQNSASKSFFHLDSAMNITRSFADSYLGGWAKK